MAKARTRVVVRVVALHQLAKLRRNLFVDHAQHAHDCASNQRHGVLRRYGVVERRRIDDALLAHKIRLLGDV